MTDRRVRLFYADWDPASLARCEEVAAALPHAELVDVSMAERAWRATGLRTVPAAEIVEAGAIIAQFDGKLALDEIVAALSAPPQPPCSKRVEPLEVVASSGSYRYGRWSEPFVTSYAEPELGWSSLSRTQPHAPWVIFDALRAHRFTRLGIVPRDWSANHDFRKCLPVDFDISVSGDRAEWIEKISARDFEWTDHQPYYWDLDAEGRFVRFRATRLEQRENGRFVCQILKFELWGMPLDHREFPRPSTGRWDGWESDGDDPDAIQKFGLYYANGEATAVFSWRLGPEASLPPRTLLEGRAKFLVLDGTVLVDVLGDRAYRLERGEWITQWSRTTATLSNPSQTASTTVLEIRSRPETAEAWGSR